MSLPSELKHLPIQNNLPVPFFLKPLENGRYDFRLASLERIRTAAVGRLCGVCGKPLWNGLCYFLCGPQGVRYGITVEPPLHQRCALYSLGACPFLSKKSHQRSELIGRALSKGSRPEGAPVQKPDRIALVGVRKYTFTIRDGVGYFQFVKPQTIDWFGYTSEGRLTPLGVPNNATDQS